MDNNTNIAIKQPEPKNTNGPKEPIPDQLKITILTSVPGYQKIEYKPSMTIKDSNEKGVWFDPLVRLRQELIDKIPEQYKISEFFNRGLFQSLLNYTNGKQLDSLELATRYGYVDNNIKVTLDTIFPVNSVIYIAGKPYTIGDVQWTRGDWAIDIKQRKEEIDIAKITDPRLYTQLVNEEITSGQEQLNELPLTLIRGPNYNGPPILQTGKKSIPIASGIKLLKRGVEEGKGEDEGVKDIQVPKSIESPTGLKSIQGPKEDDKGAVQLFKGPTGPTIEPISPEEEKLHEALKGSFKISFDSTKFFINYFTANTYYTLLNTLYHVFSGNEKKAITQFYQLVTNVNIKEDTKNLSKTAYNTLVNQVSILQTPGDGNCFFKAVADGINIHNSENLATKLIYNNYGKTQLYTSSVIREFVVKYVNKIPREEKERWLQIAEIYANDLNDMFANWLNDPRNKGTSISPQDYIEKLDYIYNGNDNFFVYKPKVPPINIDEYSRPYRAIKLNELDNYIRSTDYWANNIAIDALCHILGINIITIEKTKKGLGVNAKQLLRLPYLYYDNEKKCSSKFMFLFYRGNHYELIRFKYFKQLITKTDNTRKKLTYVPNYYTLFNSETNSLSPPLHILFLIYGSVYQSLDEANQKKFDVYKFIMTRFNVAFKKFQYNLSFTKIFKSYFPNAKIQAPTSKPPENKEDELGFQDIDGGAPNPNYYQPVPYNPNPYPYYNTYTPYTPYSRNQYITKKPEELGASKLAYTITIDMELYPGTSLTPQQISEMKCNNRYNAVRKAFASFTGRPYIIPPVYRTLTDSSNKTRRMNEPVGNQQPIRRGGKTQKIYR